MNLIPVIRMARQDGVRAVELFEGDDEGEFVLQGEGTEGPEEIRGLKEGLVVSVCAANNDGDRAGGLAPLVDLGRQLAAGQRRAAFVQNHAKVALT